MTLESKTALVTGASKGVGKGIALELARCGCDVAVNYNSDLAGAEATVAEIRKIGRRAFADPPIRSLAAAQGWAGGGRLSPGAHSAPPSRGLEVRPKGP